MAKPQVTLTFAGDSSKLEKTFDRVGASAKSMTQDVSKSSKQIEDSGRSLDKFGEAADNNERRALGFKDTLDGVGGVMQGVGQIAKGDLYGGLLLAGQGAADLSGGIANFVVPALKGAISWMKSAAIAVKAFTLSLITNPFFLVAAAIAVLVAALVVAYKKSEDFRRITNTVADGLVNVLTPALKAATGSINENDSVLTKLIAKGYEFGPLGPVFKGVSGAVGFFNEVTKKSEIQMQDTGEAAEGYQKAQDRLNDEVDRATRSLDDYIDMLQRWAGEVISVREATYDFKDAIDRGTASIKENGRTLDANTAKGRANQRALDDAASGANALTSAVYKNTGSLAAAASSAQKSRTSFINLATQMGLSKQAAARLADQLIAIPNVTRKVTIKYTSTGVNLSTPSSVGRRAEGGPVTAGMPYIVGENGPELWVPSQSGSIVPNDKLGMGGGGDTYVYVEIDGQQLQGRITKTIRNENRALKRSVTAGKAA